MSGSICTDGEHAGTEIGEAADCRRLKTKEPTVVQPPGRGDKRVTGLQGRTNRSGESVRRRLDDGNRGGISRGQQPGCCGDDDGVITVSRLGGESEEEWSLAASPDD